jgi:4-azaleucine resistance transporter AzlC
MKKPKETAAGCGWTRALRSGTGAAWPIFLGYLPIGTAFGVLAQKSGLHPFEVGLMSLLVFAGSSQFIAVTMLAAGAGASAVVATTFVVNLRHLLMSSALAPHLRKVGHGRLALLAYGITDESFAVNHARFSRGGWDWKAALAVNQSACVVWVASTMLGAWAGRFIPPGAFGIDYALIAMFLCLLVFQIRGRLHAFTAAVSGLLAVALSLVLPGNAYILLATILAATLGSLVLRRGEKGKHGTSAGDRTP